MKKQCIHMRALNWNYTEYNYDHQIMDQYGYAILRACFEVLGAEVSWVDFPKEAALDSDINTQMNNSYLRDRAILFESADGQSHFLTPKRYHEQSQSILSKAQSGSTTAGTGQWQDEASKAVPSLNLMGRSYFEGGNVFIDGGTLFHMPSTPGGFYSKNLEFEGGLSDQVKPLGLKVVNLNLNLCGFGLSDLGKKDIKTRVLYHLDCFMSVLPDGRCVISNLNLLDHDSQEKLRSHFGDRLIDLYLGNRHSVRLNFEDQVLNIQSIVNPKTGEICLVTDQVSDDVISKLQEKTGCRVITPKTLDPDSRFYNKSFSQAVHKKLVDYGFDYEHASAIHTGAHSPENDVLHHFPMHKGLLSQEQVHKRLLSQEQITSGFEGAFNANHGHKDLKWNLDRVKENMVRDPNERSRSTRDIQFILGHAGVHCLVQETFIPDSKALRMIILRNRIGVSLCLGMASFVGAAYFTSAVTPLVMIVSSVLLSVGLLIGVMCHISGSKTINSQIKIAEGRHDPKKSNDLSKSLLGSQPQQNDCSTLAARQTEPSSEGKKMR